MKSCKTLIFCLAITKIACWENLPEIPSGRRSQYLILEENGAYNYGYDTGDGLGAKQSGDQDNEVTGRYFYKSPTGENFDLKYTAGVQGFVPEILKNLQNNVPGVSVISDSNQEEESSGDASYSFSTDTDTYKRREKSDPRGNIQGSYSYSNKAGTHDLTYIAGEKTGFVVTSGSLSIPNGLKSQLLASPPAPSAFLSNQNNVDGSYSYGYSTGDSSQQVTADANNNVQGSYFYQNKAGNHDLSYVAGAKTGYLPTGGSLSQLNGLRSAFAPQRNPTGGSLKTPLGLSENQAKSSGSSLNLVAPSNSYNLGANAQVRTYLPPSQGNHGYVLDFI